ncbi:MAG: AraC family transcriptional regulator [Pirellulales bacterium]|nr:AraC family transcriptional regulator [Pirellulales bacterium]
MPTKSDSVIVDRSKDRRILDFRPLGFRDAVVLGRYSYASAHDRLEDHNHGKMLEICFLESGKQKYTVEGKSYDLVGGDLFVTLPDETHGTGETPEEKGTLFWLLLSVPQARHRYLGLTAVEGRQLFEQFSKLPERQFRAASSIKKTLYNIFSAFDDDNPLRSINLKNLLLRFLLDVLDSSRQSRPAASSTIRDVQQYIAANSNKMLSLRQLADVANLSQSRLKARFKAEVGIPPADYIMRHKVEKAKHLLRTSRQNITQIAMGLGFSSTQYFAVTFKRYTGKTPSEYRES